MVVATGAWEGSNIHHAGQEAEHEEDSGDQV